MKIAVLLLGIVTLLYTTSYATCPSKAKKAPLYLQDIQATRVVQGCEGYNNPLYARGVKGRKYIRHFSLRDNLTGDKLATLETYGYTPHRLRFNAMGRITERWRYNSIGVEFIFDECDNLISERHFPPEAGHID